MSVELKCNQAILKILQEYNIYTNTDVKNRKQFSRLKLKDKIFVPKIDHGGG
ncbi:hypothetical protein [Campylobacter insulaenigrae]|uniref:hypothetical protein n=1 Tax=Campylobacter insulaenigrae TaxID=260714 RepID=UPI00215298B7|nr:hypothetical protein [Campylobacter insulaenigrae]MCR6570674.1 hypothetical protein [Campylobacter insulaenigrae]